MRPPRQFRVRCRVRTLLLFTLLMGPALAYAAKQWTIVRARQAEAAHFSPLFAGQALPVPWLRRWMGDESNNRRLVRGDTSLEDFERLRKLFPETDVIYICSHPNKETEEYARIMRETKRQ